MLSGVISYIDFQDLIENNPNEMEELWDYCTAIGCHPHEAYQLNLVHPVAIYTFNKLVYRKCRPPQLKREMEMSLGGALKGLK